MSNINFRNSSFLTSMDSFQKEPEKTLPMVMLVGRSNVGKSSLINALLSSRLAFSSKKAGKTKLVNYYNVDNKFYLLDTPGYGSTSYANLSTISFAKMMEDGLKKPNLKAIVLLLDLRRDIGKDDMEFIRYLENSGKPLIVILTKVDSMNQKEKHLAKKRAEEAGILRFLESDLSGKSNEKIREVIASYV